MLSVRASANPKSSGVGWGTCRATRGAFASTADGKQGEKCANCWMGFGPWSHSTGERLRYLMSPLPETLPLRLALRNPRPLPPGESLDAGRPTLHGERLGSDKTQRPLLTSAVLWFCDSVKGKKISVPNVWRRT